LPWCFWGDSTGPVFRGSDDRSGYVHAFKQPPAGGDEEQLGQTAEARKIRVRRKPDRGPGGRMRAAVWSFVFSRGREGEARRGRWGGPRALFTTRPFDARRSANEHPGGPRPLRRPGPPRGTCSDCSRLRKSKTANAVRQTVCSFFPKTPDGSLGRTRIASLRRLSASGGQKKTQGEPRARKGK